jgi:hypothetical protein
MTITINVISFTCENTVVQCIKTETTKTTTEITADEQVLKKSQVIVIRCPLSVSQ